MFTDELELNTDFLKEVVREIALDHIEYFSAIGRHRVALHRSGVHDDEFVKQVSQMDSDVLGCGAMDSADWDRIIQAIR